MRFPLSVHAQDNVRHARKGDVWFLVLSTRRANASVLSAHLDKQEADRQCRAWRSGHDPKPESWEGSFEPCVRVGRIVGAEAETL